MHKTLIGVLMACVLGGCGATATPAAVAPPAPSAVAEGQPSRATPASEVAPAVAATDGPSKAQGLWIGAAGGSDFVLAGSSETVLGVWVDVPAAARKGHSPTSVALVIDTSGSMSGPKMDNARAAARSFVEKLSDGDIVSIHTFSDEALERVPPTELRRDSRAAIIRAINTLEPSGSTNLFDGLRLGENRAFAAPVSHPVRRVVVISDGIANIGPSSPEILGELAGRGAERGVQVTALGVGLDYDERTLNALAVRSSGRLYHLAEPRDMSAMLERELSLLQATAATAAFVEVVPAPGVQLVNANGLPFERAQGGAIRIPLGAMFGGQHREMLVRAHVVAAGDGSRPLASVRLHFNDPSDGNIERVQEVVARYQVTTDRLAVEQHQNEKTRAISATQEAAQVTIAAAQKLNDGHFDMADKDLAAAENKLRVSAAQTAKAEDKQRMLATASRISTVRAAAKAASMAPAAASAPAKRARALEANQAGMEASGF
jgi:Ca-activated chloride channel family protein